MPLGFTGLINPRRAARMIAGILVMAVLMGMVHLRGEPAE
jgi:hypothetical protein